MASYTRTFENEYGGRGWQKRLRYCSERGATCNTETACRTCICDEGFVYIKKYDHCDILPSTLPASTSSTKATTKTTVATTRRETSTKHAETSTPSAFKSSRSNVYSSSTPATRRATKHHSGFTSTGPASAQNPPGEY